MNKEKNKMNFLNALKKKPILQTVCKTDTPVVETKPLTEDEHYLLNVQDSMITYYLPELQHLCEDFIEETLHLDNPLLEKHHCGYRNFVLEMMTFYESTTSVEIEEQEEESMTDLEEELDPSDIIYQNEDKFQ